MRDELHLMELVDRYLDGSMNVEERIAFESRSSKNTELWQLTKDQLALREGIARISLRKVLDQAMPNSGKGWQGLVLGGIIVITLLTIGLPPLRSSRETPIDAPVDRVEDTVPVEAAPTEPLHEGNTATWMVADTLVVFDTVVTIKQVIVPVTSGSPGATEAMLDSIRSKLPKGARTIEPGTISKDSLEKLLDGARVPRLN